MKQQTSFITGALISLALLPVALGCGEGPIPPEFQTFQPPANEGSGANAGAGINCDAANAQGFLTGTCAEGLGDLLSCWAPEGNCKADIELNGDYDVIFDNGARLEHTINGSQLDARYVNASGQQCGTFGTEGDFGAGAGRINFLTAGGQMFVMQQAGDGYDIVCPGGATVSLSAAQQQVIQDCGGSANPNLCTTPDLGDINIDDYNVTCNDDSQCPDIGGAGWGCCNVPGLGGYCLPDLSCQYF